MAIYNRTVKLIYGGMKILANNYQSVLKLFTGLAKAALIKIVMPVAIFISQALVCSFL